MIKMLIHHFIFILIYAAKKKAEESFQALQHAFQYNSSDRGEVFKLMFNAKNDDEWIFRKTVRLL